MSDELHYLRHALGLADDGSGKEYRNYYASEPDDEVCLALVAKGEMRTSCLIPGGLQYFQVTEAGKARARDLSDQPPKPKLTRSQKRYQEYLSADVNESFSEYIGVKRKWGAY